MQKRKEFIINTVYIALLCALIYFGVNNLLPVLLPFILAFFFAYAALGLSRKFNKSDSSLYRCLALILIYLGIIALLSLLVSLGVTKLSDFIKSLPSFYKNTLEPYIGQLEISLLELSDSLPDSIGMVLDEMTDGIFEGLKNILSYLTSALVNITTSIITGAPGTLVSIIVMLVASFYIVTDYENISEWFAEAMPEKVVQVFEEILDFFQNTLLKIVGSYAVIMFMTFIELLIGLSIIGIGNSPMWAFVISFLDILPVLGVGTVLIPWGISAIITGRVFFGVSILILYVIISTIRNFVEPKLVGTNLGLHPLATLISMIVGVRIFGAIGLFGMPLTLSFLLNRDEENLLLLVKEEDNTEENTEESKEENKEEETQNVSLPDMIKNGIEGIRRYFDK